MTDDATCTCDETGTCANCLECGDIADYHAWQRANEAPTVYSEPRERNDD